VFAGVFKPIKESLCLVSMLNFAKRKMEKKGMINAINGKKENDFPVMIFSTQNPNEI
jgi:hypothetical protein